MSTHERKASIREFYGIVIMLVNFGSIFALFFSFLLFNCLFIRYLFFLAAVIFPSLMQLHEGINEVEDRKQKAICTERYRRRDEDQKMVISEIDDNIEEECGICMEVNNKVVLPTCSHAMCIKCYRDWYGVLLSFLQPSCIRIIELVL